MELCQRRKVKDVIQYVDYFHALDSLKLAQEIQNVPIVRLNVFCRSIFLERKASMVFQKEELLTVLPDLSSLDKIEYVGLMTMAPFVSTNRRVAKNL